MNNKQELITENLITLCCIEKDSFNSIFLQKYLNISSECNFKLLRGKSMQNKECFHSEISKVLEFPSYYGKNWDALDECLSDLEWLPINNYIILIDDIECLLIDEDKKLFFTFFDILKDCFEEHNSDAMGSNFYVILQADNNSFYKIRDIFNEEKFEFNEIVIS